MEEKCVLWCKGGRGERIRCESSTLFQEKQCPGSQKAPGSCPSFAINLHRRDLTLSLLLCKMKWLEVVRTAAEPTKSFVSSTGCAIY